MLGFAVVDISDDERAVAVWLTSAAGSSAAHSNAVVLGFDDLDADDGQLLALIADRYVLLSDRTNADHPILTGARITHCRVEDLATATATAHSKLLAAVAEYDALAGRRGVTPPARLTTFVPLDQTMLRTAAAPMVALAVADHLRVTWTAWLALNADWQRRPYLAEHPDRPRIEQLAPSAFVAANSPHPLPIPR